MKKWIDLIVGFECPKASFEELGINVQGAPYRDPKTSVYDIENKLENKIVGCRGIKCVECWNQESGEK